MYEKQIKDLKYGDRVELMEGDVAVILKVVRSGIIEVAGDVAYDITYVHVDGETTMHAVAGNDFITTIGELQ